MTHDRTFVLTGATSGMGLALARALCRNPDVRLVVGARAPERAERLRAAVPVRQLRVERLDLASLASVRAFAASIDGPIAGVACNAGLQGRGPKVMTVDGVERTFGANHLGHFLLVHLLLAKLAPGAPVVSTTSGTHNPGNGLARLFGFRGGLFPGAERVAAGDLAPGSETQQNRDWYATSKLCNILFTVEMARRVPASQAKFAAFDPGLMPGTGLARELPAPLRFAWKRVMPAMRSVVAGVSTPERSAATLADLLVSPQRWRTGPCVGFGGEVMTPAPLARDPGNAADLYRLSAALAGVAPVGVTSPDAMAAGA